MKKFTIILLAFLMLSACGKKSDEAPISFKEGKVTIDLNQDYNLDDYLEIKDENVEYTTELDIENSLIIVRVKTQKEITTLEKIVTIIEKKSNLMSLDMDNGFIWFSSGIKAFDNIFFHQKDENCFLFDDGMSWLNVIEQNGDNYKLEVGTSASYGIEPFDITITNPEDFSANVKMTSYAMNENNEFVLVGEEESQANFKYIPYKGDLKVKVLVDGLRVRDNHSTDANEVKKVKMNEEYISYERYFDLKHMWHRIGDNEWIAGSDGLDLYVDMLK